MSVHCLERGLLLGRMWTALNGKMRTFLSHSEAQAAEITSLRKKLQAMTMRAAALASAKGALQASNATLTSRLKWGTAVSRIKRYKDTVRWRTVLRRSPSSWTA